MSTPTQLQSGFKKKVGRLTRDKYIPISKAGAGHGGIVMFAIPRRSSDRASFTAGSMRHNHALIAIKVPHKMTRGKLAMELRAMQHIMTARVSRTSDMAKHFPNPLDFDPVRNSECKWLAMPVVYGFSLLELTITISPPMLPPDPCQVQPAPKTLVLHIAKQLINAMSFLHRTVGVIHNDVSSSNVMLDICNTCESGLPNLVIIDFETAKIASNAQDWERSEVFDIIKQLGVINRTPNTKLDGMPWSPNAAVEEDDTWDALMNVETLSNAEYYPENVPTFEVFMETYGPAIARRIDQITPEELAAIRHLAGVAMDHEVYYPSEKKVETTFKQWRRGKLLLAVKHTQARILSKRDKGF